MKTRWLEGVSVCLVLFVALSIWGAVSTSGQRNVNRRAGNRSTAAQFKPIPENTTNRAACKVKGQPVNVDASFVSPCANHLPFEKGPSRPIDQHCPIQGCANTGPEIAQNTAKNNLCGDIGQITQVSFETMRLLQQAAIAKGLTSKNPPANRSVLKNLNTKDAAGHSLQLSEGAVVSLVAFVLDAKHDDTFPFGFDGEGVNCGNNSIDWNDIHIALVEHAGDEECSSATAEIIPHFRPVNWNRFDCNETTAPHVKDAIIQVKGLHVRITGQLSFDGSHLAHPCGTPPGSGDPKRMSVWEIHPVYKIEVEDTPGTFITFDAWVSKKGL